MTDQEGYYAWSLSRAREGKDESFGRDLLHGFCSAVEQGEAIPKPILEYLYAGIAAYLSGEQALERALFLVNRRGSPESERIIVRAAQATKRRKPVPRIYTGLVIAALFQILTKRGAKRDSALALLEDRHIPERSAERYCASYNALPAYTPAELRRLIRDAREVAKHDLTSEQRARLTAKK